MEEEKKTDTNERIPQGDASDAGEDIGVAYALTMNREMYCCLLSDRFSCM